MEASEALQSVKTHCQAAAEAFSRLQAHEDNAPHDQLAFNYAVMLALKGLYDAIEAIESK